MLHKKILTCVFRLTAENILEEGTQMYMKPMERHKEGRGIGHKEGWGIAAWKTNEKKS